ncbi:RNA polymerase sigma factor [Nitriliruptor alkaliphilus]|uniref:RNA polymerase sigma factor n=1 Tax=Nitriliruptor alkaliphilus TaxID=427918 RepID=UPI000697D459|nr:sigma-70 family RNA polymerase sigma factor [Nitriliruptor alkaliphilus]
MRDPDGFTTFYTATHGRVLTAVRVTLGDDLLAHEAVDEAFTRAAERWASVSEMPNRVGWTYRVAVNWATSWRRKLALRPTRSVEALDRSHHDPTPDLDLIGALEHLDLDQRQMLVLRYAIGCSVQEVAATLGVAEGTVKSRVYRARQRLIEDGSWQLGPEDDDGEDAFETERRDSEVLDGRA